MTAHLYTGNLDEPVASWRVHPQNRISAPRNSLRKLDDRLRMWERLYDWCRQKGLGQYRSTIMLSMIENAASKQRFEGKDNSKVHRRLLRVRYIVDWLIHHPRYALDCCFWQTLGEFISAQPTTGQESEGL